MEGIQPALLYAGQISLRLVNLLHDKSEDRSSGQASKLSSGPTLKPIQGTK